VKTSFAKLTFLQQVIITNEIHSVTIACLNEMLMPISDVAFTTKNQWSD
jgi:hypothetical protein